MSGSNSSTFSRNIATLLGGTAIAQLVPLLATPVLTRIYSPEQFGALAVLLAVANPISLVVCGRYELTVVLPRDDERANVLARLALVLALSVSLVLAVLIWAFRMPLAELMGGSSNLLPLVLAPPLFLLMGMFQPINNWLIRKQAFRAMGVNKLMQTTGITLVSLILGWTAYSHGLMVGYIAGWALYVMFAAWQVGWKGFRFRPLLDGKAMREVASEYRSFPLYNALPAVLNTAALSIPVFLLTRVFDEHVTGQFNLCRQTIFLPVTFFGISFMQVYMQRASSSVAEGVPVLPLLHRSMRMLALLGLALVLVLLAFGPWLFGLVFGEEWVDAGSYARILAIPIAFQLVVVPLTPLLAALGLIRAYGIWQVFYFASVLALGLIPFEAPEDYLSALALLESLFFLGLGLFILRSAGVHDRKHIGHESSEFA